MALGLFDRQEPIGLSIPDWLNVYLTPDSYFSWNFLGEIIEAAATVGIKGVTLVCANPETAAASFYQRHKFNGITNSIRKRRPWFKLAGMDLGTYLRNEESMSAGVTLVVRILAAPDQPQPELPVAWPEPPESMMGGPAVFIDMGTSIVGKSMEPMRMLQEVLAEMNLHNQANPWYHPHWLDEGDRTNLRSAMVLLAVNFLCKPHRFMDNSFLLASDYMDALVANAFNSRGLRPRWQE
jgi:hypothetical protein